jgi:hypothetical protein
VKIGKSCRPEARIGELGVASHIPLITYYVGATNGDGGAIERQAQRLLAPKRTKGEWFPCPPEAATAAAAPAAVFSLLTGHKRIWASDLPLIHMLNLTAVRAIIGIVLLGLAAATGLMIAFAIQFLIIANRQGEVEEG